MGGRHVIGLTFVAAAILLFQDVNALPPACTSEVTQADENPTFPITWVPECTPELKFSVKLGAEGIVDILLAPIADVTSPYLKVGLGWNAAQDDAETVAADAVAFLSVCSPSTCTTTESSSVGNGDMTTAYQDFVLSTTSNSVHIGYDGEEPFLSLNNLDSTALFDIKNIRFVGLLSHDGDGSTDVQSDWIFCSDDFTDITGTPFISGCNLECGLASDGAEAVDGNIGNTFTAPDTCLNIDEGGAGSFWRLDMSEEKHIVGITIYNSDSGGDSTLLNDVEVFVGSCLAQTNPSLTYTDIQKNIMCSGTFSGLSAGDAGPFYKACPTNTYGQHVFIVDNSDNDFDLCEVVIHGKDIADADKTKIEFASASSDTMEIPGTDDTVTHAETVTLKRTGNAETTFTCSSIEITLDSGSATPGATEDFSFSDPVTVNFETHDVTKDATNAVSIIADCESETDETIVLALQNPVAAQIGSQSTYTFTLIDDDPKYKFSASTASVWENEPTGKVTLLVERSEYTDVYTIVHVDTMDCTAPIATAGTDYTVEANKAVTFWSDSLTQTVDIYITNDDDVTEFDDEKFCVMLDKSVSERGELVPPISIEVTILNDDTIYEFSSATYVGGENDDKIMVQILRQGKTDIPGCIDVYSEPSPQSDPDPATIADDVSDGYSSYSRNTIIFASNEGYKIVDIPINNEALVEGDETFELTLALSTSPCHEDWSGDWSPLIGTQSGTELTVENDDSTYSVVSLINSIPENSGTVTVSFERTLATRKRSGTIIVKVSGGKDADTNIGTSVATEGVDFKNAGNHTVTFESDELTATLTIPIVDDKYIELNEAISVEIVETDGEINVGRKRTVVYIINDDAYFSIQKAERTVLESVEEFHVVIQRGPLEVDGVTIFPYLDNDVTIVVNTNSEQSSSSATAGIDFITESKSVTFSGATQEAVKTCAIKVINDEVVEGPEIFFVTISNDNVQIGPEDSQTEITIEDDDGRITCSVDGETSVSVDEDEDDVTVTCTRNGINNDDGEDQSLNRAASFVLTAISGSARQGEDFNAYSATWHFPPNFGTVTETINNLIIDDTTPENEETFRLEITDSDSEIGTSSSVITVTILDNDVEQFGFEEMEYTVGESCDSLQVVIKRTNGNSGLGTTLRIAASDGAGSTGATYPDDYATREATVQFLGQQQQQIVTIDIKTDNVNEGSESFSLTLSKVSGSGEVDPAARTATITIEDQTVTYSVQDAVITRDESSGTMPVTFVRSGDFCNSEKIYVSTVDGTARSREDYISFNNRLVTFDRASSTASVDLTILDDDNEELTESFTVIIESNDIQIGTGTATVTIQDDDGHVSFREREYAVVEGSGAVTLTIDRSGNAITPTQVRVQTLIGQGTASPDSDYIAVRNLFVDFEASQTSKTFTVSIIDDDVEEEVEGFVVAIISTTDGTVIEPKEAFVTIVDDDVIEGMSTGTIIGIAAGVGGVVLVFMIIGGVLCIAAFKSGTGAGAAAAARGPPPIGYNGPAGYPPNYRYGLDYGQPQRIAYYR